MHGGRVDLPDIKALLSSGNPVVQSQGVAALISQLKPPFPNAKARTSVLSLFFDCFTLFGANVAQWCAEAVPHLVKSDVITTEEVFTHCLLKLTNADTSDVSVIVLIRLLLQLSNCLISTCFTILRKDKRCSRFLVEELRAVDIERCVTTLKVLLYSGLLSEEENISIISQISASVKHCDSFAEQHSEYLPKKYTRNFVTSVNSVQWTKTLVNRSLELTSQEILSLKLSMEHTFAICDNLLKRPEIVMNESFPANHVLLPSLFSLYSSRSELSKSLPGVVPSEQLAQIKAIVARSQTIHVPEKLLWEDESNGFMSTFPYLEYLSTEDCLALFLDLCHSKLTVTDVGERSVVFVTALLPFCDSTLLEKCCRLLGELIKRSSEIVNSLLLYFTSLYAKPYFKISKSSILKAVGGLFVNRFAITPAVNFLSIVCRQSGEERNVAFGLLGDMVTKFPTAFDAIKPLAIPTDSDPQDLLILKLNLMTTLCVATDRSDELLPSLSNLLKKSAPVVSAAISVVKVLCKEDILDVDTVRKQLGSKVRQPSFEVPLAGYCEILATAALQKEQDEGSLVEDCVKELWDITQIRRDCREIENARKAAWIALACFDSLSLINVVSKTPEDWMALFAGLGENERMGFTIFLKKMVADDLESLSRTLYTKEYIRKSSLAPFITNLHNTLRRTNQEAPWFWTATLPLFSVIVGEYAESGKGLQAIKLFRRVLREVHVVDDKVVNLFAGWRICVVSLLGVLTEAGNPLKARDQIVEECKRALSSTELSVNNVLVVMAILTGELSRFGKQIANEQATADFETTMRPWFVAVLEFMFPIVFKSYNQKSQPILQTHVNLRCVNKSVARSAVWMTCLATSEEVRNFFDDDVVNKALQWTLGQEINHDGQLCKLLTGEELPIPKKSLSISKVWMFSAALGAQELITNSISCSLPLDDSIEKAVKEFEDGKTANEDNVMQFFLRISNLPLGVFRKYERRLRRPLEQIFNKGGEEMKRAAYEGLSHLASVSLLTVAFDLPPDYGHLPEDSILRAVIAQYGAKSVCSKEILHDLLPALVDQVRSDSRHLPPMEWQFMLLAIDYHNNEEARLNLLKLAFQQKDAQIIYELTNSTFLDYSSCSSGYMLTVSNNLSLILTMMPDMRAKTILSNLLKFGIENNEVGSQILGSIDSCGKSTVVAIALLSELPTFECATDLLHKMLTLSCIDKRFNGQISRCFDFWLGWSGRVDIKLTSLVDFYLEGSAKSKVMLSIFGFCAMDLPLRERLDKIVDLMSIGKVMLSCQKPSTHIAAVLNLVLALVCSVPADIPLNWLSSEVLNLLYARWRYYWKKMMEKSEFRQLYDVIIAFLFPCFLLDDLVPPLTNAIKGMLLYILSSQPDIVRPYMEDKSVHWEKLLQ